MLERFIQMARLIESRSERSDLAALGRGGDTDGSRRKGKTDKGRKKFRCRFRD